MNDTDANMRKLQRLQAEFFDVCRTGQDADDRGHATFLRLSELADEIASIHEEESAEFRRLAGLALDGAMFPEP
ncbi:hypothetical protein [Amycolatopsis vancoresmycina]|uniref:Uncharacterized protein n=1 Tax=Amycolatopsis vancoresmycina DSM 44592 TaxID=1292037 RepID=R1ICU9_9PSEU|nr:hypothetical protein [Amycolatopsis vancoresmycina]EOD70346.1 hypothetical protein H480_01482 [Amycolatopsis vancoresmycina DSM 44592]